MESHDEDLQLLLSLQDHQDRVPDTPPALPSENQAPGYFSDEDAPRSPKRLGMAAFKDVVKDSLEDLPKRSLPVPAPNPSGRNPNYSAKNQSANDVDLEKYSGLRIRNRLVSAGSIGIRFSDLRFIRLQAIRTAMMGDNITGSWATVGVLTEKGNPKVSSAGKNYAIWKLASLDSTNVSLFLFGDAYTRHWKESAGSILSIFNAKVRREGKGSEFSLSVFAVDQVVKLGTSVDYGVCKGKRKDGTPCTMVINRYASRKDCSTRSYHFFLIWLCRRQGVYCQYHVSTTRQKYTTTRSELRGGNLATAFRDSLSSQGIYVVKPLAERDNNKKPSRPIKIMSADDLKKALNNADKVTTKHQSQGIRFLTKVAETGNIKPMSSAGKSDENTKKRSSSTGKVAGVTGKQDSEAKRQKIIENQNGLIELDLDDGSDDAVVYPDRVGMTFPKSC